MTYLLRLVFFLITGQSLHYISCVGALSDKTQWQLFLSLVVAAILELGLKRKYKNRTNLNLGELVLIYELFSQFTKWLRFLFMQHDGENQLCRYANEYVSKLLSFGDAAF